MRWTQSWTQRVEAKRTKMVCGECAGYMSPNGVLSFYLNIYMYIFCALVCGVIPFAEAKWYFSIQRQTTKRAQIENVALFCSKCHIILSVYETLRSRMWSTLLCMHIRGVHGRDRWKSGFMIFIGCIVFKREISIKPLTTIMIIIMMVWSQKPHFDPFISSENLCWHGILLC